MKKHVVTVSAIALVLTIVAGAANAADLYSSGAKTWDTTTTNWSTSPGGPYNTATWSNATPDSAIFVGSAGTVTLGEAITVNAIRFNVANYIISGNTLNFIAGGSIFNPVNNVNQTITSGITGSPSVSVASNTSQTHGLVFAPTSATQTLGVLTMAVEDGSGDKCAMTLGGTTTGNSVVSVGFDAGHRWANLIKDGTGTWTVGDVDNGTVEILAGNFVANGTIYTRYRGVELKGGVLHYNSAGTVQAGAFKMQGGALDNSSGAAITTSTHNPAQTWSADFAFIGSNGADSDLNLGTGAVTLTGGDRAVTIQNAAATLTIGGVVDDSTSVYGLTKAGSGNLRLTGNNTYEGNTTVDAGTLSIAQPYLSDSASVFLTNGAALHLDFSGTDTVTAVVFNGVVSAPGEWGGPASGADNTTNLLSGTGILYHSGGLAPEGTWYWDGPNVGGTGDSASDGGSGTWSTTVTNWDHGLVAREAWPDTTDDMAIFQALAGTVDLGSDVTLGQMLIEGADNYVIGGISESNSLHFGGMNSITVRLVKATIRAGITGSPSLHVYGGSSDQLYLHPKGANIALGDVTIGGVELLNNPLIELGGTTAGNSISRIINANNWSFLDKKDSSTWAIGDMTVGTLRIYDGTLVINGAFNKSYLGLQFNGGTLAGTGTINMPVTVPAGGTLAPGDPTGTLTVTNNNCTIEGTLAITVDDARDPAVSSLTVDVTKMLDISAAALDITVLDKPFDRNLVIATYGAGNLVGTFDSITGKPANWVLTYDYNGGTQIVLTVPSEGSVLLVR